MRKCCSSTFGINPANWENNQGSKNVSLGCQGPLFSLWCPSSAPQEVLPSGEEALTFQPRLTRPEHPTGLMRHSCLSVFFVDQLFSCISLLGNIEGSTFLSTVPKLLCPCALVGWVRWEQRQREHLSFPPIMTQPQGPGGWGASAKANPGCSGVTQEP